MKWFPVLCRDAMLDSYKGRRAMTRLIWCLTVLVVTFVAGLIVSRIDLIVVLGLLKARFIELYGLVRPGGNYCLSLAIILVSCMRVWLDLN